MRSRKRTVLIKISLLFLLGATLSLSLLAFEKQVFSKEDCLAPAGKPLLDGSVPLPMPGSWSGRNSDNYQVDLDMNQNGGLTLFRITYRKKCGPYNYISGYKITS